MSALEAIEYLDGILAKAAVNRETHDKIQLALEVIRNEVKK